MSLSTTLNLLFSLFAAILGGIHYYSTHQSDQDMKTMMSDLLLTINDQSVESEAYRQIHELLLHPLLKNGGNLSHDFEAKIHDMTKLVRNMEIEKNLLRREVSRMKKTGNDYELLKSFGRALIGILSDFGNRLYSVFLWIYGLYLLRFVQEVFEFVCMLKWYPRILKNKLVQKFPETSGGTEMDVQHSIYMPDDD